MKKIISILLLSISMCFTYFAQVANIGGDNVQVDTIIQNGVSYINVEDVKTIFDCNIEYSKITKNVTIQKDKPIEDVRYIDICFITKEEVYEVVKNSKNEDGMYKSVTKRGTEKSKVVFIDSKIYVPLKIVSDTLGYNVSLNQNKEFVIKRA